jgi:hypothetical protein
MDGQHVAWIDEDFETGSRAPDMDIVLVAILAGVEQRTIEQLHLGVDAKALPLLYHPFGAVGEAKGIGDLYDEVQRLAIGAEIVAVRTLLGNAHFSQVLLGKFRIILSVG